MGINKSYISHFAAFVVGGGCASAACAVFQHFCSKKDDDRIFTCGLPVQCDLRKLDDFVLSYDRAKKIPYWVIQHLTSKNLDGSASRKFSKFLPDPDIQAMFSAVNKDYWDSGWSRGHMAPAADYKYSQEVMNKTFFLSNILPQDLDNNGRYWNLMEIYSRNLVKKFKDVYIVSGPLFLPLLFEDGKLYMKYQVIGTNHVAVPTHLFKAIYVEDDGRKNQLAAAFVVPNAPISIDQPLTNFQVSLEKLEEYTGVEIFRKTNKKALQNLCAVEGCKLMKSDEFEIMALHRKLSGADTLKYLNTCWTEAKNKKLDSNPILREVYANQLNRFQQEKIPTEDNQPIRLAVSKKG